MDMKNPHEQKLKEKFKFNFQQGTRQDYVIQKQEHKNKNMRCVRPTWKQILLS